MSFYNKRYVLGRRNDDKGENDTCVRIKIGEYEFISIKILNFILTKTFNPLTGNVFIAGFSFGV